jgi:hypothetical protein
MSDIVSVISLTKNMDYGEIIELHDKISKSDIFNKDDLIKFFEEKDIDKYINILYSPYHIKQTELYEYLSVSKTIKFNYIDDWKDDTKFNKIILLIIFNYLNDITLHKIIGNKSKKTYKNGDIINDNSLALKKFFDNEYKQFRYSFYKNLNVIMKNMEKCEFDLTKIENTMYSMIDIIQADIACRNKYNSGEYYEYKTRINDIVETRKKEDILFELYHKIVFKKLVNDDKHESLKYLLFNGWDATKNKHLWLINLITFINNGSEDAKDYLVNNIGINNFTGSSEFDKKKLIEEVAKKVNLNTTQIKNISKYIFSIGTFYKHKTYNKWYKKELEAIETFDKYKEFDLLITLNNLIDPFRTDENNNNINDLLQLLENYYITLNNFFQKSD